MKGYDVERKVAEWKIHSLQMPFITDVYIILNETQPIDWIMNNLPSIQKLDCKLGG